jgi:hypothetical protein
MLEAASDLERDVGITGDDFIELIEAFAKEFNVDMSGYTWYFHHGEEGSFNPGALLFRPPHRSVPHLAVTPDLLLSAARVGRWPVVYPRHALPKRRYDILLTCALLAIACVATAMVLASKAGG